MRDFAGKVAVVTGAASGMGLAFAERFASEGMKVVLADVEEKALSETVQRFRELEHDAIGVLTDVSNEAAITELAKEAVDTYRTVNVLCNNAGVVADSDLGMLMGGSAVAVWEQSLADWEWTLGVNLWGVVHGIRTFLPIMLANDEPGHVVNTASIAGLTSGSGLPIYGVSKHGVVRLSEALHHQLAQRDAKIGVSVLCPGGVKTRIALATRNRPEGLVDAGQEVDSEELERREAEWASRTGPTGMAPEAVADLVLKAIEDERFYILTHDEYDDVLRNRMENILARNNPTLGPF